MRYVELKDTAYVELQLRARPPSGVPDVPKKCSTTPNFVSDWLQR